MKTRLTPEIVAEAYAKAQETQKLIKDYEDIIKEAVEQIHKVTDGKVGTFFLLNYGGPFALGGNECPMCVLEMLTMYNLQQGMKHNGDHSGMLDLGIAAVPPEVLDALKKKQAGKAPVKEDPIARDYLRNAQESDFPTTAEIDKNKMN